MTLEVTSVYFQKACWRELSDFKKEKCKQKKPHTDNKYTQKKNTILIMGTIMIV